MAVNTLKCTVDSYSNQDKPATNFGNATKLLVNGQTSHKYYAHLFFAKPFPAGATIVDATLRFYCGAAWAGANTVTAKRITGAWKESTLKHTNVPAVSASNTGTVVVTGAAASSAHEIDVTAMLQDVANGGTWYGIRLEINTTGAKSIWSGETALPPVLEITWAVVPNAPADLSPPDLGVVSGASPTVAWRFSSSDSQSYQAKSQVQVSTSSDFSSPAWDSTLEANTTQQKVIGLAGIDDGETFYWRVRVQDNNGVTSPWSDAVRFTRENKATVYISEPTGDIEQTSPPVSWIFGEIATLTTALAGSNNDLTFTAVEPGTASNSIRVRYVVAGTNTPLTVSVSTLDITVNVATDGGGAATSTAAQVKAALDADNDVTALISTALASANDGTGVVTALAYTNLAGGVDTAQEAYQLILRSLITNTNLYDSGRVVDTDNSVEVPAGYITSLAADAYRIIIRVWDTYERVSQPNDPPWSEDYVDVTFAASATPDPVDTLEAVAENAEVVLTWTRADMPDYFALKVDGRIVFDRLDPTELNEGQPADTYEYRYCEAMPQEEHTYEVQAVVTDVSTLKHSTGNPTVDVTTDPPGLWILEPATGNKICLMGADDKGWAIGEEGQTYYPIGRRDPVRVTTSLRGYEGGFSGELHDYAGLTADEQRDALEDMKGHIGAYELRLVGSGYNFAIQLGPVSISPKSIDGYDVSGEFFQVGDFTFESVL